MRLEAEPEIVLSPCRASGSCQANVAYSISTWCWDGGGPIDHSSAAQRRRGVKSGKVRRAKVASRDRAIVEAYGAGASMRAVAREWELTEGAIRHVLGRGVRNEPNQ